MRIREDVRVTLFVAGAGPNSRAARSRLRAWCERLGLREAAVEVVDVVVAPDRAVRDGVMLTPQLLVRDGQAAQRIVGTLDGEDVGVVLRAVVEAPA